jgi:hypothetical protein
MRRFETPPSPVIGWSVRLALVALMVMPVSTRALGQQWPNEAYRVEWEEAHIPDEVAANVTIAVPVTLRNTGDRAWPAAQVLVSYHWFRDGKLVVWDGERSLLPRDLRAGSRATLAARVTTPAEPGSYVLTVTLVQEHVTWFEHKGANTVQRPVAVRRLTRTDGGSSGFTP